jgi:hypothetical protein
VVVVEGGGVAMQQEELGELAVSNSQDLVKIVDADYIEDKEATEALPTTQTEIPKIVEHCFRLCGNTHSAPSWTPDKDEGVPNRMGGSSEQVRFLVQGGRHTNVNATAALRTILSRLGPTDRKGCYLSSSHAHRQEEQRQENFRVPGQWTPHLD